MSNANLSSSEDLKNFIKDIKAKVILSKINTGVQKCDTRNDIPKCKICGEYVGDKFYSICQTNYEPPKMKCRECGTEFQGIYDHLRDQFVFTFNCTCKQQLTDTWLESLRNYKAQIKLDICEDCAKKAGIEEVFGIDKL